jgi:hypothetical protein
MPIESSILLNRPEPIKTCPECKKPFHSLMRGLVQRTRRSFWGLGRRRPYCCMICAECKEIVGWEDPELKKYHVKMKYLNT